MLYVASYNELEQLATHASVIKLSFGHFFIIKQSEFIIKQAEIFHDKKY